MEASLQLDEDRNFGKRFWRIQRACWVGMAVAILAALLGLLGVGPLDTTEVEQPDIRIRYSRFERMSSPTDLAFTVTSKSGSGNQTLWISRPYLEHFQVEQITPEPDSAAASPGAVIYSFRTVPDQPLHVRMHLRISEGGFGFVRGRAGTQDRTIEFWQFIWP